MVANPAVISQRFLYFLLMSLRGHFNGIAQGAAQQNISKEKVANTQVIVPPLATVRAFDKFVDPIFDQLRTLQSQVRNLQLTRDLLLPRLLSGQISPGIDGSEQESLKGIPIAQYPASGAPASLPPSATAATAKLDAASAVSVRSADPPRAIDDTYRTEVLCTIRSLFGDDKERERDAAICELAHALGYKRTGARVYEVLSTDLQTAVRRGIIVNTGGAYRRGFRTLAECTRESLKESFESAIGRGWMTREDAIRSLARWLGFARVGPVIDETGRSLINGLIRERRLETDGPEHIRRA